MPVHNAQKVETSYKLLSILKYELHEKLINAESQCIDKKKLPAQFSSQR